MESKLLDNVITFGFQDTHTIFPSWRLNAMGHRWYDHRQIRKILVVILLDLSLFGLNQGFAQDTPRPPESSYKFAMAPFENNTESAGRPDRGRQSCARHRNDLGSL